MYYIKQRQQVILFYMIRILKMFHKYIMYTGFQNFQVHNYHSLVTVTFPESQQYLRYHTNTNNIYTVTLDLIRS